MMSATAKTTYPVTDAFFNHNLTSDNVTGSYWACVDAGMHTCYPEKEFRHLSHHHGKNEEHHHGKKEEHHHGKKEEKHRHHNHHHHNHHHHHEKKEKEERHHDLGKKEEKHHEMNHGSEGHHSNNTINATRVPYNTNVTRPSP
jgi:hypothetical protein